LSDINVPLLFNEVRPSKLFGGELQGIRVDPPAERAYSAPEEGRQE
jgi:hypothetical protein